MTGHIGRIVIEAFKNVLSRRRSDRAAGVADCQDHVAVLFLRQDPDAAARAVLSESGRWLGMGLASLLHILSPERILIGGGVAAAGELLLDPLRAALCDYGMPFLTRTLTMAPAALSTDAGILGAAAVGLMG